MGICGIILVSLIIVPVSLIPSQSHQLLFFTTEMWQRTKEDKFVVVFIHTKDPENKVEDQIVDQKQTVTVLNFTRGN